jgi:hypothetical protein
MTPPSASTLATIALVPLLVWRICVRFKRATGRQRLQLPWARHALDLRAADRCGRARQPPPSAAPPGLCARTRDRSWPGDFRPRANSVRAHCEGSVLHAARRHRHLARRSLRGSHGLALRRALPRRHRGLPQRGRVRAQPADARRARSDGGLLRLVHGGPWCAGVIACFAPSGRAKPRAARRPPQSFTTPRRPDPRISARPPHARGCAVHSLCGAAGAFGQTSPGFGRRSRRLSGGGRATGTARGAKNRPGGQHWRGDRVKCMGASASATAKSRRPNLGEPCRSGSRSRCCSAPIRSSNDDRPCVQRRWRYRAPRRSSEASCRHC